MLEVGLGGTTPELGAGTLDEPPGTVTDGVVPGTETGGEAGGFAEEFEGGTVPVSGLVGAPTLGATGGAAGLVDVTELLGLVTRGD